MTDNEIIKAFTVCITSEDCSLCPMFRNCPTSFEVQKQALDLINRQKAEIENMNNLVVYNATCATKLQLKLVEAKAEAVKEFAEKLRYVSKWSQSDAFSDRLVTVRDINDLEKEMVGEAE